MNTPDTEWRGNLGVMFEVSTFHTAPQTRHQVEQFIAHLLTSRDTYWKERVVKLWDMLDDIDSVPDMLHPNTERGHESTWKMMVAIAEKRHKILKTDGFTLTPITNEDAPTH